MDVKDKQLYMESIIFMKKTLMDAGRDCGRRHKFRSRSAHTCRVLKWAERLSEGMQEVDRKVLFLSCIFHDIGYVAQSLGDHQQVGADIFREFAEEKGLPTELTEQVAHSIEIHSEKGRMADPEKLLTKEELLLMEADLLDEEGALAICWDGLACGYEYILKSCGKTATGNDVTAGKDTAIGSDVTVGKVTNAYQQSLARTVFESKGKLEHNPMVTQKGREFWQEKQRFIREYIEKLEFDLEEWKPEQSSDASVGMQDKYNVSVTPELCKNKQKVGCTLEKCDTDIKGLSIEQSVKCLLITQAVKGCEEEILALYHSVITQKGCTWNEDYPGMWEIHQDIPTGNLWIIREASIGKNEREDTAGRNMSVETSEKSVSDAVIGRDWAEEGRIISAVSVESGNELDDLPFWTEIEGKVGEIARVVVARDCQGRHLAANMLMQLFEKMREEGYGAVHLLVSPGNPAAFNLYKSLGFVVKGECDFYNQHWFACELVF